METIVIQTQSKSTSKLLVELAKKLGEKAHVLDKDIAENLVLGEFMQQEKTGQMVSNKRLRRNTYKSQ
ncbi:MAG: hypothetical protein JST20_06060 [Bacteroidetes bacterium]|nr:hypothetical protein [Bacteroidota bacterium]